MATHAVFPWLRLRSPLSDSGDLGFKLPFGRSRALGDCSQDANMDHMSADARLGGRHLKADHRRWLVLWQSRQLADWLPICYNAAIISRGKW